MLSKKYQLNIVDLQKILRNIAIIYSPVILLFLDQIQQGQFDYKVIIALAISTSIDIIRRLLTDYTKNTK